MTLCGRARLMSAAPGGVRRREHVIRGTFHSQNPQAHHLTLFLCKRDYAWLHVQTARRLSPYGI